MNSSVLYFRTVETNVRVRLLKSGGVAHVDCLDSDDLVGDKYPGNRGNGLSIIFGNTGGGNYLHFS